MKRAALVATVAALMLVPGAALACPVCGAVSPEARDAFLEMTVFMSLTPLVMVFGLILLAVRRVRAAERALGDSAPDRG